MTAKSSNASKVNENSEIEQNTKKTEEKKDKREEKREKRPEITINDIKKPDLSTIKRSCRYLRVYNSMIILIYLICCIHLL